MNLLETYLNFGFSPIPLSGKTPLVKWKDFTLSTSNKQYWVDRKVNWGLRTGLLPNGMYFFVVDLDSKSLLADFMEANPLPDGVPIVSTARGFHLYLAWTERVKTSHLPGIDIIANGFVAAPPSVHPTGKIYRFLTPLINPLPLWNPETPHTQIVLKARVDYARPDIEVNVGGRNFAGVPQGQRHNTLVYYLGAMVNAHFIEEEALSRALTWNTKNRPPLSKEEVINTVRDCYERWDRYEVKETKGG